MPESMMLRIYLGENDRHGHRPLYEAILEQLCRAGIAGATALRGVAGFGARRSLHADRLLDLAHDLPLLIEAVDTREHLEEVLPAIRGMMAGGLITMTPVTVVHTIC